MEQQEFVDITLTEGEDYGVSLTFEDDNGQLEPLDQYGLFEAQIRRDFDVRSSVQASFVVDVSNAVNGELRLTLAHGEMTDLLPLVSPANPRGRPGFWDLFGVNAAGSREYLVGGRVRFIHTITRSAT
ncbi:hypothetical protein HNR62_001032 [Oceanisphaera litoralis]|uniref:hypothetical protein n=1 Tax=Oceanisphaera litoralis TaxID=225144 RepID=UPI0019571192|nr:hypothetical protein [Oceanisphaera litoralis]MBM7455172.1 hypothetical protein [Oceanisphaera litoralis]